MQPPLPLATFTYTNSRGLFPERPKIPMLEEMTHNNDLLFLALTETQLNSNHLNIKNYTVSRRDRISRSHGGVAIYIKEEVALTTEEISCF